MSATMNNDLEKNFNFQGRRALVTGAGQGIGRAIAVALVQRGAEVVAVSKTECHLIELQREFPGIHIIVCDVTNLDDLETAVTPYLPFHFLVNNAGTNILEHFLDITPDAFDRVWSVNLRAPLFLSQIVAKSMVQQKIKGSIVHISSQASYIPVPKHASYMCSKRALDSLASSMAFELGQYGIRINCVNPTVVLTTLGKRDWSDPVRAAPILQRTPLHKFAEVDDVVRAVLFLLSDNAAMINGVCLPVDGGLKAC